MKVSDEELQQAINGFEKCDPFGRTMRINANGCGCHSCNPRAAWFVTCDICGCKRCPHATNCKFKCTNSNEPGQIGVLMEVE